MVVQNYNRLVFILIFGIVFCWIIISQIPDPNFHLIACDVGQGDAILAVYKNYQILTDGGPPNGKVNECLSRYLPFWDRTIEVVVDTHPQLDHYGGMIEVFKNYKVETFIGYNNIGSDLPIITQEYRVLENVVGSEGVRVVRPDSGTSFRLGLMSYDIFWPIEGIEPQDLNNLSVQSIVSFGEFEAILTGDIGNAYSNIILEKLPIDSVDYIKVPHHGSANSMLSNYLNRLVPKVAVISVSKDNSYGHPAPEILKMLDDKKIKILRTDEVGDVEIVTNGNEFWVVK